VTLDRFVAIRKHLLDQEPLDPPLSGSELLTILLFAERWLHLANDLREV